MNAVVAVYADWGIGAEGTQPVTVKADRRHFRELTEGAAVIVGRKTLADFPGGKPLKNRVNLVLTRSVEAIEGAVTVRSVAEAVRAAAQYERCFVIGGASVYRVMLPWIDRVYVTKLDCTPKSDVFFPNLDRDSDWMLTGAGAPLEENGLRYRFLIYERSKKGLNFDHDHV